jgi:hypothetical protein
MPENYHRHPEAGNLPAETKVWLVQNSGKKYSGAVSMAYNFEGGGDDEFLVAGCNAKSYPHAAISRHGNFLQWGYGEPPSKMTEDGRRLFVNCLCYIRHFAGRPPLVRRQALNRRAGLAMRAFPDDLTEKYKGRESELYQLYKDDIELLRYEEKQIDRYAFSIWFSIDDDLKALGIPSNRRVETLERLIALLSPAAGTTDPNAGFWARRQAGREQKARVAKALVLVRRYTDLKFTTPAQWQQWLDQNRGRIFFSDFGGYKFRVLPKDYPGLPLFEPTNEGFWFPR